MNCIKFEGVKMQALVFERPITYTEKGEIKKPGRIVLKEVDNPVIKNPYEDVIIQVANCGVCGTDLKIFLDKHPAKEGVVLGHELCGTIVDKGPYVEEFEIGDRAAIDNNERCKHCENC